MRRTSESPSRRKYLGRRVHKTVLAVGIGLLVGLLVSSAGYQETSLAQTAPRPNVIVIMTDDQDAKSIKYMPKLNERLAKLGTKSSHFFASTPLCCPDRASFLSGQYAHNHGVFTNDEPDGGEPKFRSSGGDKSTIATWMKSAGYRTGYLGKYLNGYTDLYIPPGWDRWYAFNAWYGQYSNLPVNDQGRRAYFDTTKQHEADMLAGRATTYIRNNAPAAAPFFLVVATNTPHAPANVASRHRGTYSSISLPKPPNFNETNVSDKPSEVRAKPMLTDAEVTAREANYRKRMESLRAVDDLVGKVLDELRTQKELRNTHIIYTSDNGWFWGEHRLTAKAFPYEEGARMPLIVRGPGVPQGRTLNHLLGMHDLAPTIARLAGTAPPASADGKSFTPLLLSTNPPTKAEWRRDLLIESRWPTYQVLRTQGGYYYAEWPKNNETEFYNLNTDPYQLNSAHNSAPRWLVSQLAARLSALRTCAGSECRTAEGS